MSKRTVDVTNNIEAHPPRFEAHIDDQLAMIQYQLRGDTIVFTHTEVPVEFEGQGIASQMAHIALEHAKTQNLRVLPLCPYVAGYIKRHPEYQSLVD